jgi:hypothetical protein
MFRQLLLAVDVIKHQWEDIWVLEGSLEAVGRQDTA